MTRCRFGSAEALLWESLLSSPCWRGQTDLHALSESGALDGRVPNALLGLEHLRLDMAKIHQSLPCLGFRFSQCPSARQLMQGSCWKQQGS